MGNIFKKKTSATQAAPAVAPEEPESVGEIKHIEELSESKPVTMATEPARVDIREVPVCLSQAQVNNMIIENNMMLKQILSEMD